MAKITNYALGTRGILMKDGTTVWVDPGRSVELDKKDVDVLPDLGSASESKASADDDTDLIAELTKQIEALTDEKAELAKIGADLAKDKAELTKQIEALTKPAK